MACVAFPTCGLAMAESERYLPSLISKIEDLLDEAGVNDEEITIRMTDVQMVVLDQHLQKLHL